MYAQLGDIVFEALKGFESLSDKRETLYAEHALINGKPLLKKVGESLIEFSGSIHFHVAFCNPEDEYKKLNDARANSEILPFIYGTGFIEGNFVITTLERTFNQTDLIGNFISITCNITFKEFISSNSIAIQQERDKSNAFAISSNRPLPLNPNTQPDNPSLAVMNENKLAVQAGSKVESETGQVNLVVNNASSNTPISKAQAFVDSNSEYTQKVNNQLTIAQTALTSITNLVSQYPGLLVESPSLNTVITNAQNSITALQAQNASLGSLPSTVSDIPTALSVLNQLLITTNLSIAFIQTIKDLNKANASIAMALALKKKIN